MCTRGVALADFVGIGKLYSENFSTQVSSLRSNWKYLKDHAITIFDVKIVTLDLVCHGIQEISLFKVDCEGNGYAVLKGATNILKKTKAVLIEVKEENYDDVQMLLIKEEFKISLIDSTAQKEGNIYGYRAD